MSTLIRALVVLLCVPHVWALQLVSTQRTWAAARADRQCAAATSDIASAAENAAAMAAFNGSTLAFVG